MTAPITTPSLSSKVDPEVKRAIQTLVMHLQTVAAETAAISQSSQSSTAETVATVDEAMLQQAVEEALADSQLFTPDYTIPLAPTGLTATGGFNQILIEWSAVPGTYVGHYEIFRNNSDVLGTSTKIGTTSAIKYVDIPPDSSLESTYFYWVRAINKWDASIVGQFNATAGTSAATANDPTYVLEVLQGELSESHLAETLNSRISKIDTPVTGLIDRLNNETTARQSYDLSLQNQINNISEGAAGLVYVQPGEPIPGEGEVPDPIPENTRWYDLDDNNHPYVYQGGAFQDLQDQRIGQNEASITSLDSRLTDAEGDVSGNASAISVLDTTVTDHDGQIASIASDVTDLETTVNDPSAGVSANAAGLSVLDTRVTSAENTITAQSSSIASLESDVSTAQGSADGNATAISGLDTRVTSAEGSIASQSSQIISLQSDVSGASSDAIAAQGMADANATAISGLDTRVLSAEGSITANASSVASLDTRLTNTEVDVTGNASAISTLDTRVTDSEGDISAQAGQITLLQTYVGSNTADIATEQTVRADGDSALASDISILQTTIADPATGLPAAHAAIVSEAVTRSASDSSLSSQITSVAAQTLLSANAYTEGWSAEGADVTDYGAITTEISAAVQVETTARTTADGALAESIETVEAVIENPTTGLFAAHAAVQTEASARANSDGTLGAEYAIKVNVNGHIAGMGVAVSGGESGPIESEIIMLADKFAIVKPAAGEGESLTIPFMVGTVNGAPAVVMSEALIGDLTVGNAAIKYLSVDDARISNVSGGKITTRSITASKYNELRNSLIFNGWDSLDATHPFEVPFLLLSELTAIQSVKLSFKILPYRGYSTAALDGGGQTSNGGAGTYHMHKTVATRITSGDKLYWKNDGKLYTSGYSRTWTLGTEDGHTHTITIYYGGGESYQEVKIDINGQLFLYSTSAEGGIIYTSETNGHKHAVSIMQLPLTIDYSSASIYNGALKYIHPSDTWKATQLTTMAAGNHTHNVSDHAHGINFGIYEESNSPSVTVNIDNGSGYGTTLGFAGDQLNLDLTSRLSGAGWKMLKFTASARCRIAFVLECKLDISA